MAFKLLKYLFIYAICLSKQSLNYNFIKAALVFDIRLVLTLQSLRKTARW